MLSELDLLLARELYDDRVRAGLEAYTRREALRQSGARRGRGRPVTARLRRDLGSAVIRLGLVIGGFAETRGARA